MSTLIVPSVPILIFVPTLTPPREFAVGTKSFNTPSEEISLDKPVLFANFIPPILLVEALSILILPGAIHF